MNASRIVGLIYVFLVAMGSLNWGSVALFNKDLVRSVTGPGKVDTSIKAVIGLAGVFQLLGLLVIVFSGIPLKTSV